jgi:hypothetical protein
METWHLTSVAGGIVSAIGAFLAFDAAPLVTVALFVASSLLGGVISSRYVMRGVPKLIDEEIARHLEQFHREYVPPPKPNDAAPYRAPR